MEAGVITPYARQVGEAKQALKSTKLDIEVKSVDGFQGRYERNYMVHRCIYIYIYISFRNARVQYNKDV